MINRQAQSITGMYSSTPIHLLLGLIPASILLDYRQHIYTCRLLKLSEIHLAKNILPIRLKKGDQDDQPEEIPKNSLMWTQKFAANLIWTVVSMTNHF